MTDENPTCPAHPYAGAIFGSQWQMVCPKCKAFLYWAKPPGLLTKPACPGCGSKKAVRLHRVIAGNNHEHIAWYCISCDRYAKDSMGRLWLPKNLVTEFLGYWNLRLPDGNVPPTVAALPLAKEHDGGEPCAICGHTKTEYNHFMPQVFRSDADIEPEWAEWDKLGAWLCEYHHRVWHTKIAPLWALAQVNREVAK